MDIYEQLIRDEGLELKPYEDTVGKLTIGVGRNLTDVGISRDEAYHLLHNDVETVCLTLEEVLPWITQLSAPRYYALVNMAFNMGISRLLAKNPKMLQAVEAGSYGLAAQEMLDGPWKDQVGDRAHRLAQQMETGEWV